jgi:hypothetical protein
MQESSAQPELQDEQQLKHEQECGGFLVLCSWSLASCCAIACAAACMICVCPRMLLLQCLPICVDIGTNNPVYLEDSDYRGIKAPRVTGEPCHCWCGRLSLLLALQLQSHMPLPSSESLLMFDHLPSASSAYSARVLAVLQALRHTCCAFACLNTSRVLRASSLTSHARACLSTSRVLQALSLTRSWARCVLTDCRCSTIFQSNLSTACKYHYTSGSRVLQALSLTSSWAR